MLGHARWKRVVEMPRRACLTPQRYRSSRGARQAQPSARKELDGRRASEGDDAARSAAAAVAVGEDDGVRQLVGSAVFPTSPGVYVVYRRGEERPLYVGVAATQTIQKRWRKQHLRARAGGSALRRSLGLHLGLVATKLKISEGRYYAPDVENEITRFLEGCEVSFFPTTTADEADDLEVELRAQLRPELNIASGRRRRPARHI